MSAIAIDKPSALVLIDPQQGILAPPALLDPDDIKTRDQRLAAASRASTLPVAQVKLAFRAVLGVQRDLRDGAQPGHQHHDVRHPYLTPLNAGSHAGLPPAILVTNGFDPLRDVGHAYARKLAAAGNDLTYIHNPDLTHGFPQFTRSSAACHQATLELADLIKTKIG